MKMMRILFCAASALVMSGCTSKLEPGGAYAGDDILYRADLTISTGYDLLHSFVKWEYQNRAAVNPKTADRIRTGARGWISSAIALRDAYAANPTTEGRQALQGALAVIQAALREATAHMAASSTTSQQIPVTP